MKSYIYNYTCLIRSLLITKHSFITCNFFLSACSPVHLCVIILTNFSFFESIYWYVTRGTVSLGCFPFVDPWHEWYSQVAAINTAVAALTKTIGVFPKERKIVDRERAKGSYASGPYLFSKLLTEIPIGAVFPLMFGAVLYPMTHLHPTLLRLVS